MFPRLGPPGPVGTVVGTAVVAGTATAVSGRVSRRQQQRFAEEDAARAPHDSPTVEQTSSGTTAELDYAAELQQLAELKAAGILTQEEFDAKKRQILGI